MNLLIAPADRRRLGKWLVPRVHQGMSLEFLTKHFLTGDPCTASDFPEQKMKAEL